MVIVGCLSNARSRISIGWGVAAADDPLTPLFGERLD
jgi:hypothetical protein